jgi:hypothetical protein
MTDVGYVLDISDAIAQIPQIPHENVKTNIALGMPKMRMPINRRPTDIDTNPPLFKRHKLILLSRQTIMKL